MRWSNIQRRLLSDAAADAVAGRRLMSEKKFLLLLSVVVGLLVGLGAELLRFLIGRLSVWLHALLGILEVNWLIIFLPVVGILLCGIYCRYIVKDDMEFGCERIRDTLRAHNYRLRGHLTYAPILSCALTLGFGGSSGSEGPIAYAGAGVGSNVGKFFNLSPDMMRILLGCGAGAGIAGIFKAPIGGALFAIEVIGVQLTTVSVFALLVCCVAAWFISYLASGMTLDLPIRMSDQFDAHLLPAVLLLGLFCGLYSIYYNFMMHRTERVVGKISNPWLKNVISGLVIGLCLFLFPVLYGDGYGFMGDILNGRGHEILSHSLFPADGGAWIMILFVGGMLLVKSMACALTNAGGGVGGDFAPTLFAGCFAGMLFAMGGNAIFGMSLPVEHFAYFGMAGVMAGTIRAPLMAMFLTSEMSGDFGLFLPLMTAALISFATARLLTRRLGISIRPSWRHRSLDNVISRF